MARAFCIPGIILLFSALVLNFLVSISLPYLSAMDVTRVHFPGDVRNGGDSLRELRWGVWSSCYYSSDNRRTCLDAHHGYLVALRNEQNDSVIIGSSWTRGLAVHPVATAATFVAFALSFSQHLTWTLISSLVSFLAATLTLIAFAIDIALYAYVKHQVGKLPNVNGKTDTGPAFWMTFVALILLLLGGCTVCFGRRRDRMSSTSYPSYPMSSTGKGGFLSRFRRK